MAKRILIADDAAFMRSTVKNFLVRAGYEIAGEAVNGKDAAEKYETLQPDLVLMDITMPEMDGIAALKTIRSTHPDARIIMMSGMGQQSLVIEAITAGAKDFILKPFNKERVLGAVATYI